MSGIESAISSEENKKTSSNEFKTAGVLGGMGPEATLDLHRKILSKSDAEKDQENIPVMIFNNPQIPDRSDHILNDGECPLDEMVETARSLERAGADFIVIPCNTAHHFFDDIDSSVGIETINLIEEATDFVVSEYPEAENIGLLITTGSMETEVYSSFIEESGREPMVPDDNFQDNVMDSIYEIKKGEKTESKKKLEKATENLIRKGSDAVIMGCTEIPLVLSNNDFPVPLIDPVEILAEKVVEVSKNESSYSA
ncbi:MAG: aspartate/glutamate racemase family protein [Candidatus Aenigmatarchaeota archaeon]